MLERDSGPTTRITYLVTADLDLEKCSGDHAKNKLADALTWVEGAGRVEVIYLPTSTLVGLLAEEAVDEEVTCDPR